MKFNFFILNSSKIADEKKETSTTYKRIFQAAYMHIQRAKSQVCTVVIGCMKCSLIVFLHTTDLTSLNEAFKNYLACNTRYKL